MSESECKITSDTVEQSTCVLPETLQVLPDNLRYIFMGVFITVSVFSLIGNVSAICAVNKRKYRYIQKTCIISLAVSDIMSTIIIALNNIETFSHPLLIWTLGGFLCSFVPWCQMTGILASSLALMMIAMDRYRNVVHALSRRWNPSKASCLSGTLSLWLISFGIWKNKGHRTEPMAKWDAPIVSSFEYVIFHKKTVQLLSLLSYGVSFPLYHFFIQSNITLVYFNVSKDKPLEGVDAHLCVTFDKETVMIYYIIMVFIIFLPLLCVFFWSYYKIASLIWKHRKPVSDNNFHEENSTSSGKIEVHTRKSRDFRVERKIRTFKIIVTLMTVFIICRLPYFTIYIMKLSLTSDEYGLWTWILNYIFTALHIVNCFLNPLLYTFLNQTLKVWVRVMKVVKDFFWEICCFCFAHAEFDEFEEKENPFGENYEQKSYRSSKVKFEENVQQIDAKY